MRVEYGAGDLRKDLIAGATVAAIALPQAMAYALIAGVDPRFGLYSAIVVTAVASMLGSSSHLINGPTNAISLVVFSALAFIDPDARPEAYEAMFLLGLMVGALQIGIAIFRIGDLTRYISESVVHGFLAGAAFLIALGQVGNLLGLPDRGTGHQTVVHRFWLTASSGVPVNPRATAIGLITIALVVGIRRLVVRYQLPRVDLLLALIVASVVAWGLGWSVAVANHQPLLATVGRVSAALPSLHVPVIQVQWLTTLSGSALAIAVLGLLEALSISKAIATRSRQALDFNQQCLAEGLANLVGGLFQCLPGSGSLTRSAINFQSGAVSRLSGVIAAALVALVVFLFAPMARFIPKTALAALLIVTAVRLVDWVRVRQLLRATGYDPALVIVTAITAAFISVEWSILTGVGLSILFFVSRATRLRGYELALGTDRVIRRRLPADTPCSSVVIYDIEGDLFFGAASELDRHLEGLRSRAAGASVVVLRLRRTRNADSVCVERLDQFLHEMEANGVTVLLSGVRDDLARTLRSLGFDGWLTSGRVFVADPSAPNSSTIEAVRRAHMLAQSRNVRSCEHCSRLRVATEELYYVV
jgi:SulP family sulfate permease